MQFSCSRKIFLERQLWHFRGVESSLLGPHQTGARRDNSYPLTWPHNPHDHDPMNPPDPSRDEKPPAGDFRGVASSIQGPHSPPAGFPAPPLCQPTPAAAAARVLPEAKPRQQIRSPGAAATMAACSCTILAVSGQPPLCQFGPRTRRQRWRRKRRRR